MTDRFSLISPTEETVLAFDFSEGLDVGETLVTPTVACVVDYGTDASPTAILGAPTIDNEFILVPVSGLSNNVDYHITVTCTTSNASKVLAVAGILPVRTA